MGFKPGQSGNPNGARLHKSNKLRAELLKHAPDVVSKLVENAKAGDPVALRLFLERVLPALKPEAQRITLELPEGSMVDTARAVIAAAVAGDLPIDQASELVAAIGRLVPLAEHDELRGQVRELMEKMHGDIA